MRLLSKSLGASAGAMVLALSGAAWAQEVPIIGQPTPQGIGFQPASTVVAEHTFALEHMILTIITVIVIFVTALLIWVMIRYNKRVSPKPASFTHNTPLEIAWTLVPILILVFIGAYSLPVLFMQQEMPVGEVNIKATGNQWYWSYEYPKEGISFDALMIGGGENRLTPEVEAELQAAGFTKEQFLLATDNAVVVPVGKIVLVTVTGSDVIHSWKVPAFGVMQDAVPGRLAQTWFKVDKEGYYFGQCSELCGKDHAYMPIMVKAVSEEAYNQWVTQMGGTVADAGTAAPATVQVASN